MERCIAFIGDNAADCVKTNAFLNLPKEALIKLISSDFVSVFLFVFANLNFDLLSKNAMV